MKVHNVGMATKDLDRALNNYLKAGFELVEGDAAVCSTQNLKSVRIKDEKGKVLELLTPADPAKPSQIDAFLADTDRPVLEYYMAFETGDIARQMEEMKQRGYTVVRDVFKDPYETGACALLFKKSVGNIKLVEV